MSDNAKNRLQEFFQAKGWDIPSYIHHRVAEVWHSSLDSPLPDGRRLVGHGTGARISFADIAAAEDALVALAPDLDAEQQLKREAQVGDALIKLAAYLSPDLDSVSAASAWLQRFESNDNLSTLLA